jgi:Tol biopolymer transport system component
LDDSFQAESTGWGSSSFIIYGWSRDSSRLYFRYLFLPDGGGFEFWWDGFDLQGIDIATGEIKKVIPVKGTISFAFSPDETKIAYIRADDDPQSIIIRNLDTGYETKIDIDGISDQVAVIGNILWAPDGKKVAFLADTENYVEYTFYLEVSNMMLRKVMIYEITSYFLDGWTENGMLKFMHGGGKSYIIVDPLTGEIVSVLQMTPTPRP